MESTNQFRTTKCPSQDVLLAYCSGKLSEVDLEAIDSHLATCETCLSFLDRQHHGGPDQIPVLFSDQESAKSSLLDTAFNKIRGDSELERMKSRAKAIKVDADFDTESRDQPQAILPQADDNVLPEKIGPYLVADRLGRGAFANVYLASDPKTGQQVAIKVPRRLKGEEQVQEFLAEAQQASKLAHPGIVRVFDFDRLPGGGCYVVMTYIEGQSLDKAMESERFSHERIAELGIQIAGALEYVHQKGFVHRDIKPANILLDKQGRSYVADFGLAIHETLQHEFRNQRAGTWHYMSPEQVRGQSDHLDGRSDLWSLGVILYELLTRQKPFPSKEKPVLKDQILFRAPKTPRSIDREIPKELEEICLACLAKDVSARTASAAEVAESLRAFLQRGRRTRRRALWAVASLLVVVACLLLVGGLAYRPSKKIPLLETKPAVVFGYPRPDPFFDPVNQVYSVGATKFRWMASVHRRPAQPVHLHATVSLKDWVGAVGFAWQVHDLNQLPGQNNRWLVAEFYRPDINGKCYLVVQLLTLSPGGNVGIRGIADQDIEVPPGSAAEMDLTIEDKVLSFSLGSQTLEVEVPVAATNTQTWLEQGELTVALTGMTQTTKVWNCTLEPAALAK